MSSVNGFHERGKCNALLQMLCAPWLRVGFVSRMAFNSADTVVEDLSWAMITVMRRYSGRSPFSSRIN